MKTMRLLDGKTITIGDSPERLQEMVAEERDARSFGITVERLRQQRRELGQLLTGPYAGCSPGFVETIEMMNDMDKFFKGLNEPNQEVIS